MEGGPIILVVDDDAGTREAVRFLLEDEGYVVEVAANGQAALARMRGTARTPSLVLLDLMMPGMDGETLLREIEALPELPRVPIVVMTASGPSPSTSSLQYPLLRKPFGLETLMEHITTYCPRLWDDDEPSTDESSIVRERPVFDETPIDRCSRCEKRAATRCTGCGEAFCKKCIDAGPDGRCARCYRAAQRKSP